MSCKSCGGSNKAVRVHRSGTKQPQSIRTQVISVRANRKLTSNSVKVKVSSDVDKHRR